MNSPYSVEAKIICDQLNNEQINNLLNEIHCADNLTKKIYSYQTNKFIIYTNYQEVHDMYSLKFKENQSIESNNIPSLYVVKYTNDNYDTVVLSPTCLIIIKNSKCMFYFGKVNLRTFKMVGGSIGLYEEKECINLSIMPMLKTLFEIELLKCLTINSGQLDFLHASCVLTTDKPILFCGESHSGKSTLAVALSLKKGYTLYNDDNTCIDLKNKAIYQYPHEINIREGAKRLLLTITAEESIKAICIKDEGKFVFEQIVSPIPILFLSGFSEIPSITMLSSKDTLLALMNHFFIQEEIKFTERFLRLATIPFQGYKLCPGDLTQTIELIETTL